MGRDAEGLTPTNRSLRSPAGKSPEANQGSVSWTPGACGLAQIAVRELGFYEHPTRSGGGHDWAGRSDTVRHLSISGATGAV
jgi:hypothetical protein